MRYEGDGFVCGGEEPVAEPAKPDFEPPKIGSECVAKSGCGDGDMCCGVVTLGKVLDGPRGNYRGHEVELNLSACNKRYNP